jgi:hypothetical protein
MSEVVSESVPEPLHVPVVTPTSRLHELLELLAKNQEILEKITEENKAYYEELAEITKGMGAKTVRKKRATSVAPSEAGTGAGAGGGGGGEEPAGGEAMARPTRGRRPRVTIPAAPGISRTNSFNHFFSGSGGMTPQGAGEKKVKIITEPPPKKTRLENFDVCNIFDEIDIDPEFVQSCLDKCDVSGDVKLFREIFVKRFTKDTILLRYIGSRNYQYRRSGIWIDDHHGTYVRHVLLKIFEKAYMHVNELENYTNNTDQFISNQEHIIGLSDDKYYDKLMSQINAIIDIKR